MEFFDTHSHYNDEKFDDDREMILEKIYDNGVTKFIVAGYNLESSKKALEIANKSSYIYATAGISPNDVTEREILIEQIQEVEELAKAGKIVAIGEIGLDYYWNKENKEYQKEVFIKQIELANKMNLPIVIHTRDAVMDTIEILKNKIKPVKLGVFHCCPLNRELVKEALKLGFYISLSGTITFKNSKNANEIIELIPIDRMFIETDSPYLSPEPNRGKRNDSRNLKYIAQKIAEVKKIPVEEVAKMTYKNTCVLFKISH